MPTVALSTEYVATDGVWWNSAGNAEKITLIQGMIAGLEEGWSSGADAVWFFSPSSNRKKAYAYRLTYSKTFVEYVTKIDSVEANRSISHIPISTIMVCLADKNPNSSDCIKSWAKYYPNP